MALVKIEGSELELDDSICKSDKSLKDALSPYYPAVSNADIKRETKGGRTVITVTKRAGSKGNFEEILCALESAPEWIHPALVLEVFNGGKARDCDVDEALISALNAEVDLNRIAGIVETAPAQGSHSIPEGF